MIYDPIWIKYCCSLCKFLSNIGQSLILIINIWELMINSDDIVSKLQHYLWLFLFYKVLFLFILSFLVIFAFSC